MKSILKTMIIAAALTAVVFAQGPRGPQAPGSGQGSGPQGPSSGIHSPDMTKLEFISGAVTKVNLAYGLQNPSIEVNGKTIRLAPVYYLAENGFEVEKGNLVDVKAVPCADPANGYLFAVSIKNVTANTSIDLRDPATGEPLWTSRGPGAGQGQGQGMGHGMRHGEPAHVGGGCIDPASIKSISGTATQVNMGLGIQMPTLTVKTASGDVTMKIGPERILLAAGFTLEPGEKVEARYAVSTCQEENVALSLKNASGVTVKLRNDDGSIAW